MPSAPGSDPEFFADEDAPPALPPVRGYAAMAVRVGLISGVPFGLAMAGLTRALGGPPGHAAIAGLASALVFGVGFGATTGWFLRGEAASVQFGDDPDEAEIMTRVEAATRAGLRAATGRPGLATYKGPKGKVSVRVRGGRAGIAQVVQKLVRELDGP